MIGGPIAKMSLGPDRGQRARKSAKNGGLIGSRSPQLKAADESFSAPGEPSSKAKHSANV
jgi:hypothetical protein